MTQRSFFLTGLFLASAIGGFQATANAKPILTPRLDGQFEMAQIARTPAQIAAEAAREALEQKSYYTTGGTATGLAGREVNDTREYGGAGHESGEHGSMAGSTGGAAAGGAGHESSEHGSMTGSTGGAAAGGAGHESSEHGSMAGNTGGAAAGGSGGRSEGSEGGHGGGGEGGHGGGGDD